MVNAYLECLGWQDSNLRMVVPKTTALPLGYTPMQLKVQYNTDLTIYLQKKCGEKFYKKPLYFKILTGLEFQDYNIGKKWGFFWFYNFFYLSSCEDINFFVG
jgi:hypothetical protein